MLASFSPDPGGLLLCSNLAHFEPLAAIGIVDGGAFFGPGDRAYEKPRP